ncbi:hypothetical protein STCU_01032 [Strigomonas culicis]|uniref:Uncharacterized protein n=1 Tax=Strigomonas culicis TaxID=28005 RepID=S9UXR0_9TRYP|nr:hypothetical protein STCU_01032 [Strigomonas culicis]|eukprot:EPY35642.1 hypothetical protein STCU_01032 [Strigomonas culicis]
MVSLFLLFLLLLCGLLDFLALLLHLLQLDLALLVVFRIPVRIGQPHERLRRQVPLAAMVGVIEEGSERVSKQRRERVVHAGLVLRVEELHLAAGDRVDDGVKQLPEDPEDARWINTDHLAQSLRVVVLNRLDDANAHGRLAVFEVRVRFKVGHADPLLHTDGHQRDEVVEACDHVPQRMLALGAPPHRHKHDRPVLAIPADKLPQVIIRVFHTVFTRPGSRPSLLEPLRCLFDHVKRLVHVEMAGDKVAQAAPRVVRLGVVPPCLLHHPNKRFVLLFLCRVQLLVARLPRLHHRWRPHLAQLP